MLEFVVAGRRLQDGPDSASYKGSREYLTGTKEDFKSHTFEELEHHTFLGRNVVRYEQLMQCEKEHKPYSLDELKEVTRNITLAYERWNCGAAINIAPDGHIYRYDFYKTDGDYTYEKQRGFEKAYKEEIDEAEDKNCDYNFVEDRIILQAPIFFRVSEKCSRANGKGKTEPKYKQRSQLYSARAFVEAWNANRSIRDEVDKILAELDETSDEYRELFIARDYLVNGEVTESISRFLEERGIPSENLKAAKRSHFDIFEKEYDDIHDWRQFDMMVEYHKVNEQTLKPFAGISSVETMNRDFINLYFSLMRVFGASVWGRYESLYLVGNVGEYNTKMLKEGVTQDLEFYGFRADMFTTGAQRFNADIAKARLLAAVWTR